MKHITTKRKTWEQLLQESVKPVLLPVAHENGEPLPEQRAINMDDFMNIVDLPYWAGIEKQFEGQNI